MRAHDRPAVGPTRRPPTNPVGLVGLVVLTTVLSMVSPAPASAASPDAPVDLAGFVDPFVGTAPAARDFGTGGGAGDTFPGAAVPFGMVQWSPDTVRSQPGGYLYTDDRIRGFSLTHFSGAGCVAFGDIPFLPLAGTVTSSPASDPGRYVAGFSHRHEQASPGYYRVRLASGPRVELTATERTGMARFTFDPSRPATVLVNVAGSAKGTDDAQVTVTGPDTVSGWASSGDFCGAGNHYRVFFVARFDRPFASFGTWRDGAVRPGVATARGGSRRAGDRARAGEPPSGGQPHDRGAEARLAAGPGSGAWVSFDPSPNPTVTVRVGLSFVDTAGAARNLRTESGSRPFEELRSDARRLWNRRLGTIRIAGGTPVQAATFYTGLYHAFLHPNVFSDVDGRYAGFDGRVHTVAAGHIRYANFSGWDIYRSQVQLLALLAPRVASDIARSMLDQAVLGGAWDRWSQANGYTGVMVGDPYQSIVASVFAFGARDFDARAALASMVTGATRVAGATNDTDRGYVERPGLADYLSLGYVPSGEPAVWGPAATTLEYATADFGVASLAGALGESAIHAEFMRRAQSWQNLFDPVTGYLRPRGRDGSFAPRFDPASTSGFVEGNGAQYTWMVPHDPRGLFDAMGGDAAVRGRLARFFGQLDAGPNAPFAFLGNEPTLLTPWLYDYAGAPWRTQAVVRQAVNTLYRPTPDGYVGNDDLGELSSWHVWAAMGMYPQVPGRSELVLASPLFPRVTIHRPSGQTIDISAPGAGAHVPYVRGLTVNGQRSVRPWLPADFVNTGGSLHYVMSRSPDRSWGADPADAPPSFRAGEAPMVPFVDPGRVLVPPGAHGSVRLGARGISGRPVSVHWVARAPAGVSVSPAAGEFRVSAGGTGRAHVTLTAAVDAPAGFYRVPVTLASGAFTRTVTFAVVVARPGSPLASYDNVGSSADGGIGDADYDGSGYSYSARALAAAGVRPGGTLTVAGLRFGWPAVPVGEPDNTVAAGQTIELPGAPTGPGVLSLLGSATNGPSHGTLTVLYTDGTRARFEIGFGDWTLGAGGTSRPPFGNLVAAHMPYRNRSGGGRQVIDTYLFATAPIPVPAGKRVRAVVLPSTVDQGMLHVFAVATGPV